MRRRELGARQPHTDERDIERGFTVRLESRTERRERPPGELDHLERADDAAAVAGLDARRRDRVARTQPFVRVEQPVRVRGLFFQPGAYHRITTGDRRARR